MPSKTKPWSRMKLHERIEEALSCSGLSNTPSTNGAPETDKYADLAESILNLPALGVNYDGQKMVRYYRSCKKARLAVIQAVIRDHKQTGIAVCLTYSPY